MFKKLLWALLGVLIMVPIVGSIAGIKISQFKAMGASAAQQVVPRERVNTV